MKLRALGALLVLGAAPFADAAPARSDAQADRGAALYAFHCAACHGASLAGAEAAPPLAGAQFAETWNGQTARALFDRIVQMPPGNEDALTRQQRIDVLAFLLRSGGQPPAAAELSGRGGDLDAVVLQLSPQP